MVERYRIFAFTTFYRADSHASPEWLASRSMHLVRGPWMTRLHASSHQEVVHHHDQEENQEIENRVMERANRRLA